MFFVWATGLDARVTTMCTEQAAKAVMQHLRLEGRGLAPTVTDWTGRRVSFAELQRQAEADTALAARH